MNLANLAHRHHVHGNELEACKIFVCKIYPVRLPFFVHPAKIETETFTGIPEAPSLLHLNLADCTLH